MLDETGLAENTWVVFMTDHGPALPAREVHALRRGHRHRVDHPAAAGAGGAAAASTTSCSAAWICCPRCWNSWGCRCPPTSTDYRTREICWHTRAKSVPRVYTTKTYHDSFDPDSSDKNQGIQLHRELRAATAARPALGHRGECARAGGGAAMSTRHVPSANSTTWSPTRPSGTTCSPPPMMTRPRRWRKTSRCQLNDWRSKTNDVIPSEFAGTRISERYTQTYAHINGIPYPSRSADGRRTRHRKPNNRNSCTRREYNPGNATERNCY